MNDFDHPPGYQSPPAMAAGLESERSDRARLLAREETDRAVALADKRARYEQRVESRLDGHDSQLRDTHAALTEMAASTRALVKSFEEFVKEQTKRNIEADTKEKENWKEEGQAISKKQLLLGFGTVAAMVFVPAAIAVAHVVWGV